VTASRLSRLEQLEHERDKLLRQLGRLEQRRHAAIVAELDAGASLTAVAARLGISRQALTKYLDRRENHHA
jgi:DNA-directed RNA polymerase specialized sigma subunit